MLCMYMFFDAFLSQKKWICGFRIDCNILQHWWFQTTVKVIIGSHSFVCFSTKIPSGNSTWPWKMICRHHLNVENPIFHRKFLIRLRGEQNKLASWNMAWWQIPPLVSWIFPLLHRGEAPAIFAVTSSSSFVSSSFASAFSGKLFWDNSGNV
jgi:hypothetical protein